MPRSNNNTAFEEGWVIEGVPTEEQRKEEKRQVKAEKKAAKANNPYGIANVDANYSQQYGQTTAVSANYYQGNAANGAAYYDDAAAGHAPSYNYQVVPAVVTNTFVQHGANYDNANANYQGGGGNGYYDTRTYENYRTDVATDVMVETIDGGKKKKKGPKI